MDYMRKVVAVEMHREMTEVVLKEKRHDYAKGGFLHVSVIERRTRELPQALLECGHYRRQLSGDTAIASAKRLRCLDCAGAGSV